MPQEREPEHPTDKLLNDFNAGNLQIDQYETMIDVLLICNIHHAMQNDQFLIKAAETLQPFVKRIIDLPDCPILKEAFQGSKTFGRGNPGSLFYLADNSHLNDLYLNKGEFGIARLLYQLKEKIDSLNDRNETDATNTASILHDKLTSAFKIYLNSDKGNNDRKILDNAWKKAIGEAKPKLEKHRGWANFIVNMLLMIPTLGGFMIYEAYRTNCKSFLFPFVETDSANCIKKLEKINKYTSHPATKS
jgi:hypothetical protein